MYISNDNVYYVYACKVDGTIRYIGKGLGERYMHCLGGRSTCKGLNRDYYAGKKLEVEFLYEGLTEQEALRRERREIKSRKGQLYNKAMNQRDMYNGGEYSGEVNENTESGVLFKLLQEAIERESKFRMELEHLKCLHSQMPWNKMIHIKSKGKTKSLEMTTYLLMFENAKLRADNARLTAQNS